MAHARCFFDQALDKDPVLAGYFLEQVQKRYLGEEALRENQADWEKRLELRQELAFAFATATTGNACFLHLK
jgi:hypothetical protein